MLCVLTLSELVLKVATPAPFNVPLPMIVAPSLKSTVPVGVPVPGATAVTVAVKVTDWPNTDGFWLDARLVELLALFTTCETAPLVLPLKLPSPLYTTVMLCVPTVSVLVL